MSNLEHCRRFDDAADAGHPSKRLVLPIAKRVIKHGDPCGTLHPWVRVLPEDAHLPCARLVGLQRLEGELADRDDVRWSRRPDELRRVGLGLNDGLEQWLPRIATGKQRRQLQRVISAGRRSRILLCHLCLLGRRDVAHGGGCPTRQAALSNGGTPWSSGGAASCVQCVRASNSAAKEQMSSCLAEPPARFRLARDVAGMRLHEEPSMIGALFGRRSNPPWLLAWTRERYDVSGTTRSRTALAAGAILLRQQAGQPV